ncbi:MAG: hypothetical protein ACRDNT_11800 [Streptosporangiaceae bacterium]
MSFAHTGSGARFIAAWGMRTVSLPPLTRSTPWIDVLTAGQSAEVRTRLPLRWGYPS